MIFSYKNNLYVGIFVLLLHVQHKIENILIKSNKNAFICSLEFVENEN